MTIDCLGLGKRPLMLKDKVLIWQFNHGRGEVLHDIYDKYKSDLLSLATADELAELEAAPLNPQSKAIKP